MEGPVAPVARLDPGRDLLGHESGAKVSFRQIHEPSGKRVHYEKTVQGIGPVDRDDIVKGYEVGDDEYILIDPEEIDEIKLEDEEDVRDGAVRRRLRNSAALFRQALLPRAH